ncbi:RHS repeat-associated core domain-containing protein [Pseudomonas sp. CCOS 191]|uniref:RHS repeat-associated core domain-containing protein n=1 Tax=Pseudomonas sp. CCOS 191 TaxID=1649877 RepID=UPI00062495FC|nr:RHS repeat-associated core domain-containing protein [Pseudomonas sp. CCOS 191]CRI59534.1 hypothetical protein CCOS191_4998 [Pseudomonas sp. CCOS 191]
MRPKHLSPSATSLLATDMQGSILRAHTKQEPLSLSYATYGFDPRAISDSPQLRFNAELRTVAGFYLLGSYRAYNPILMRFHSPDYLSPFGAGNINAYVYCSNDPVNYTDASGHMRNPLRSPAALTLIGGKSIVDGKLYRNEIIGGQTRRVQAPGFTASETIHLQQLKNEQQNEILATIQEISNLKRRYGADIGKLHELNTTINRLNEDIDYYINSLPRTKDPRAVENTIVHMQDKRRGAYREIAALPTGTSSASENLSTLTKHLSQLEGDLKNVRDLMRANTN